MSTPNTLLYDTRRASLWFRIPAMLFGLFLLWLAASIVAETWLGVRLGFPGDRPQGSPVLAVLASVVVAAVWIFVWFAQLRIWFDDNKQEFVVRTNLFFFPHDQRISLVGGRELRIESFPSRGITGGWKRRVEIEYSDGRKVKLLVLPLSEEVNAFALRLEAATKLPVHQEQPAI